MNLTAEFFSCGKDSLGQKIQVAGVFPGAGLVGFLHTNEAYIKASGRT